MTIIDNNLTVKGDDVDEGGERTFETTSKIDPRKKIPIEISDRYNIADCVKKVFYWL